MDCLAWSHKQVSLPRATRLLHVWQMYTYQLVKDPARIDKGRRELGEQQQQGVLMRLVADGCSKHGQEGSPMMQHHLPSTQLCTHQLTLPPRNGTADVRKQDMSERKLGCPGHRSKTITKQTDRLHDKYLHYICICWHVMTCGTSATTACFCFSCSSELFNELIGLGIPHLWIVK